MATVTQTTSCSCGAIDYVLPHSADCPKANAIDLALAFDALPREEKIATLADLTQAARSWVRAFPQIAPGSLTARVREHLRRLGVID